MGKELAEMIDEIGDGGSTITIEGDTLVISDNTSPVLLLTPSALHFDDTVFGQNATLPITVTGKRLTGNVTIGLTGSGFSANKQTLTPDVDGIINDTITITFAPTGSGEDVEYSGVLTATHGGVQMASVNIDGTGVAAIVPSIDVTMDGEDVSAIALKGVLSSTAEGDYSDAPSKATIHIEARNISNGVTLALTGGSKFALSKNSLTAEEALAGADIVVSYNRQAAVTQTNDTDTLTITCGELSETIDLSGATGAKATANASGTKVAFSVGQVSYGYESTMVLAHAKVAGQYDGDLHLYRDTLDEFGYKYTCNGVWSYSATNPSNGFKDCTGLTSLVMDDELQFAYASSFQGCTSLKSVKCGNIQVRASSFAGCSALETFDCVSINFNYNMIFSGCNSLRAFVIRQTSGVVAKPTGNSVWPATLPTFYVPSDLVPDYESAWGSGYTFAAIEGSIYDTQSQPVNLRSSLRSPLRSSTPSTVDKVRKGNDEHPLGADAQNVAYSGGVAGATNVKDALDALAAGGGGGGSDMSSYGYYGQNFPEQMRVVKKMIDNNRESSYPRLRFIHISDSHGDNIGYADSLLANTGADFVAHTGDGVGGNYGDGVTGLYAKMLACTKPFFFTIGNHDCLGSPSLAARYTRYIEPIVTKSTWYGSGKTLNHPTGKTYYSVDYTKSSAKYKCIFLDQADGIDQVADDSTDNSTVIFGTMSNGQVDWFLKQLQSAATAGQHVMVFLHVRPDSMDVETLEDWCDHENLQALTKSGQGLYTMPINIIDAFQTGGSYTFNSQVYSFSGEGIFVGWFVGHAHCDCYGWSKLKENQPIFVTTQPHSVASNQYDQNAGGPHVNYITVDYAKRKVILFRLGADRTWWNTKRETFYIDY